MTIVDSEILRDRYAKAAEIYKLGTSVNVPFSGRTALLLAEDIQGESLDTPASTNLFRGGPGSHDELAARRLSVGLASEKDELLKESAKWIALTVPKVPLLSDQAHPLASEQSKEQLLPHTTAWAQSVYLATKFRLDQLRQWTEQTRPQWLDEDGNINPYSLAKPLDDAGADQERNWLLAELNFLRDLERHGQLFIDHALAGKSAFEFRSLGKNLEITGNPDRAQIQHWQRTGAGEAQLFKTPVPGKDDTLDERLYTAQAQILSWQADLKNLSMEQASYTDPKDDSERSLLLFRSDWVTTERVLLLDRLLTRYAADGGLQKDSAEYASLFQIPGGQNQGASIEAPDRFKEQVEAALAQANVVLQNLGRHIANKQVADLSRHYLLNENREASSVVPVRMAMTGVERFGLSLDPARVDAGLANKLSSITTTRNKLSLNRGFQPWAAAEIKRVAYDRGHLSNEFDGQLGLKVHDKIRKQEELIELSEKTNKAQTQEVARLNHSISILKNQETEMNKYAERMEKWSASAKEQNKDLRREIFEKRVMIGLLSDMLTESRILFNQQAADFIGEKMPAVAERSHLAEVLQQEGFNVDPEAMLIYGMPTSEESFKKMERQRESKIRSLLGEVADTGRISRDFVQSALPTAQGIVGEMRQGKQKTGFLKSLFLGDDDSRSSSEPKFM